jgi:queuine tRNA-ribosyltransferase
MSMRFEILERSRTSGARAGRVHTAHGWFDTPAFMPVGTRGAVKGLTPAMVRQTGAQIVLGNTYHLLLRPGADLIERRGGLHRFMNWNGPILTDSGGYQAYSMADLNRLDDDGVTFRSIVDGSLVTLTPERAIQVQHQLGADVIMAFDDCPAAEEGKAREEEENGAEDDGRDPRLVKAVARDGKGRKGGYDHRARLKAANERTVRWLERCKAAHDAAGRAERQALFGIVQGGTDLDERTWSAQRVGAIDLPGYAIGGVAVGEAPDQIARVVRHTAPLLPESRPRYLMGVGYERDLLGACLAGVDMFDCVLPTRNGRNASAFTATGQVRLRNASYAEDDRPIEPGCDCPACSGTGGASAGAGDWGFTRAYIRHLFLAKEMLGPILVSLHNLRYFQRFMLDIRRTVRDDDWSGFVRRWPAATEGLPART